MVQHSISTWERTVVRRYCKRFKGDLAVHVYKQVPQMPSLGPGPYPSSTQKNHRDGGVWVTTRIAVFMLLCLVSTFSCLSACLMSEDNRSDDVLQMMCCGHNSPSCHGAHPCRSQERDQHQSAQRRRPNIINLRKTILKHLTS